MATLPPAELLRLWSRDELPVEMATGHLLQHLVSFQTTLETLKTAVSMLQGQIDALAALDTTRSLPAGTKKSRSKR